MLNKEECIYQVNGLTVLFTSSNFDGYANSPYSITVAAIDRINGHPAYSEACTAVMVSMYSSGAGSFIVRGL